MSQKEISEKIKKLSYDPKSILIFHGNKVENLPAKEGKEEDGSFIVVEHEKKTLSQGYDVLEAGGNYDKTYPGALVLANDKLVDGIPVPLLAKRSPVKLSVNLPNQKKPVVVNEPNYATIGEAIDNSILEWKKNGSPQNAASLQIKKCIVNDEKSLSLALGCNVDYLKNKLNLNFDMTQKGEMSAYIVQYKQVYYTVSAIMPDEPGEVFDDSVEWKDLEESGVNSENPPAMITTVQYGRTIYALFKSKMSSMDLSLKVDGKIGKGEKCADINGSVKNYDKDSEISCEIVMLGGNAKSFTMNFDEKDFGEKINKIIMEGLTFSDENPAYPVSYTASFLKNGECAKVNGTTEYTVTTSTKYDRGTLELEHIGAYIARFYVSWKEIIGFDEKGPKYREVIWEESGKNKTAKYTTQIDLGGNVRDISIKAQGKTGLVWDQWRTSFDRKNLPMVSYRKVKIWGTTLNQQSSCETK